MCTFSRARFHIEIVKKWKFLRFLKMRSKMRSTKCARDCSESFVSCVDHIVIKQLMTIKIIKNWHFHFLRWGRQNVHETVARARFHIKIATKKTEGFGSVSATHSFQTVHSSSFMSRHSFQFIRFNSFVSIHSCQFIHFTSFMSCVQFSSFVSIC